MLEAADNLLAEVGFAAVTIEGIAARAGVGKQTIYRWWPSKTDVLMDAFLDDAVQHLIPQDSGNLGRDLRAHLRHLAEFLTQSDAGTVFRALAGQAQHDAKMAERFRRDYLGQQRQVGRAPFQRAIERGELPADTDIDLAVDQLVDEVELPVRRLDPRLGKIPGVSAASLDENGLPLLILDVEDLIQTALGHPASTGGEAGSESVAPHILVVDDSHTVREMERRLLVRAGYQVTTAQNGQEAWNLLRLNDYDLLISDIDMPQMNGIELVTKVRGNARLGRMPVIILSYKGRDEDRRRGLEAGADFYLTKGDFQNENFRQAVVDLIGTADAAD